MEEQKKNPAQGLSESEQVQVRRQKLADLQAAGRDPFTLTKFPQDAYSADLKEEFKDLPNAVSYTHLDVYKRQPLMSCVQQDPVEKLSFIGDIHPVYG